MELNQSVQYPPFYCHAQRMRREIEAKRQAQALAAERELSTMTESIAASVTGLSALTSWTCDVCGQEVTGRTAGRHTGDSGQ